jgi:hypothetical protein
MRIVSRPRLALALVGLACLAAAACGSKARFADTVEGKLTKGTAPLAGVRVQFVPQDTSQGQLPLSSATTDEKGFFRLTREDNGKPGAVLGKHKVVLVPGRPGGGPRSRDEDDKPAPAIAPVPDAYHTLATTPLEIEIKADQKDYPLQVK